MWPDYPTRFNATLIDAIHDLAQGLDYTVLVLCSRDDEAQERTAILTAIGRQVDGIFLCPSNRYRQNLLLMQQARIPCVLVSRREEDDETDSVVCDEEAGGYLVGMHLISAGHRKLGYFYNSEVLYSSERRMHGFLRAAREAGIPESDVQFCQNSGAAAIEEQLRQWKAQCVTGLFVFCDIEAWQLLERLTALGMADDFVIIGFDNVQELLGIPMPLCTVDGSMREVTASAVALLLRRIQGDDSPPEHLVFPARLVCRGNCRHTGR